jgi:amino acid transporter
MFSTLAIILLISSFILPWWGFNQETEHEVDGETRSYSQGYGITLPFYFTTTGGIGGATLYGGSAMSSLILLTTLFIMCSLIFMCLFLVFLVSKFIEIPDAMKLLNAVGILAMIFCLMAPLMFMFAFPSALEENTREQQEFYGMDYEEPDRDDPTKSFFGNYEEEEEDFWDGPRTERATWGGDIGWFLSFFAFIFFLMAMIMLSSGVRERPPMQAPYPGVAAQPPQPGAPVYQTPPPPPQYIAQQQAQGAPQALQKTRVTCPGCKNPIEVEVAGFPAPIKCPICGTSGFIE